MKLSDFDASFKQLIKECWDIQIVKGADYAGKEDKLRNFKHRAEEAGLTKYQVWSIYAGKHWDSIASFIRAGKVESEPIRERIKDMINYLTLLNGLLEEDGISKPQEDHKS